MDWNTILLYALGILLFSVMMVFPDKRDWIDSDEDKGAQEDKENEEK